VSRRPVTGKVHEGNRAKRAKDLLPATAALAATTPALAAAGTVAPAFAATAAESTARSVLW
jgi:hypothetical protein